MQIQVNVVEGLGLRPLFPEKGTICCFTDDALGNVFGMSASETRVTSPVLIGVVMSRDPRHAGSMAMGHRISFPSLVTGVTVITRDDPFQGNSRCVTDDALGDEIPTTPY